MATQNGTPECKNHIKTFDHTKWDPRVQEQYENILRHHIKSYDDTKWDPRVQEPYQNILQHKMGPQSAITISKHVMPYQNN